MKKLPLLFLLFTYAVLLNGCNQAEHEEATPYQREIYKFVANHHTSVKDFSKDDDRNLFLYYDHKLTCQTCIMDLMEIIKAYPQIPIISNFDSEKEAGFFKEAYKLKNLIINIDTQSQHLPVPFIFEVDKDRFFNIMIFDDELINSKSLENYMKKTKKNSYMFFK
jgi:hypothetical protein